MSAQVAADRFWLKVEKSGSCWEWTAARTTEGYGSFTIDGKTVLAHRVAYHGHEFTDGNTRVDSRGKRVCATCRPLTPWSSRTHCKRGHAFDKDNTRITSEGRRYCRACQTLTQRARRAGA